MKLATSIIAIASIICCIACKSTSAQRNISGEYSIAGKDYEIVLNLQRDSSFIFKKKSMEVLSESRGKWKYNFPDTVILIRDSVALPEVLSSGYIKDMPDKAFVQGGDAIRIEGNLLKRKR